MILRSVIAAGVAAVIGGQAAALTCADNQTLNAFFVHCGVDGGGLPVGDALASLQGDAFTAASPESVSGGGDMAGTGMGGSLGSGSGGTSAVSPEEIAAGAETPRDILGEEMPINAETPKDLGEGDMNGVQAVPLPAGGLLLLGGLAGLGIARRSRKPA